MSADHEQSRRDNLEKVRPLVVDPYRPTGLSQRSPISAVRDMFRADYTPQTGPVFTVAGRIMLKRGMGKLVFLTVRSEDGHIQVAADKGVLVERLWEIVRHLDLGDIVVVTGHLAPTQRGEPTIWMTDVEMAGKALLPPPDKAKGLHDPELRYRNRHLDLTVNPEVMEVMKNRSRIVAAVRECMGSHGFLEVETPALHHSAGGAAARPFGTHHNALDIDLSLRVAPELYLKRLLIGGMEKVFEVGKNFRNEGISPRHNPEFTALEAYQAFGDYTTMMRLTEDLFRHVTSRVFKTMQVRCGDHVLDFQAPFRRVRMADLAPGDTPEEQHRRYEAEVEPTLIQPTFVTHLPKSAVPLAKESREFPGYAEVFELVVNGQEVAPGYTEQTDPDAQLAAFEAQAKDGHVMDRDFVEAMKAGMPPAGGMGLGIDRMVAILTNQRSIRDVILFPLLRPEFA